MAATAWQSVLSVQKTQDETEKHISQKKQKQNKKSKTTVTRSKHARREREKEGHLAQPKGSVRHQAAITSCRRRHV